MCRLAGYVGRQPIPLSALLYEPVHSLEHASYAPRELLSGTVNVDGTGAAWWPEDGSGPLRYVTSAPPWADPNLPGLAPSLCGTTMLAAVRMATPGLPFGPDNVAPFVTDGLAGAHNGHIDGFRHGLGRTLLSGLSDARFGQFTTMNDSLALFLMVAQHLENDPGSSLSNAVTTVIQQTAKAVIAAGETATLNLVVATSGEIVAARTSAGEATNSLYTRTTADAGWLASEPLEDNAGWQPVPEHSLAVVTADGVHIDAIEHEGMTS